MIIPTVITVFLVTVLSKLSLKTPPVPVLLLKALGIKSGSGEPNKTKAELFLKPRLKR